MNTMVAYLQIVGKEVKDAVFLHFFRVPNNKLFGVFLVVVF